MKFIHRNVLLSLFLLLITQSCNYNYYRGTQLEEQERYEEANIEYHRAFTASPNNEKYREAFLRTAAKTTEDLLERYEKYVSEKRYTLAFRRLQQAHTLTPENPTVIEEMKKWYRILLAGKVDLVEIKSLNNQIPLTDQIILEVRFNTPNVTRRLEAKIDYATKIFYVEDVLYDPPQNLLMLYSINSIGVKLVNNSTKQSQFKKFVDFKVPVLVDVRGQLTAGDKDLTAVSEYYPLNLLNKRGDQSFWYPTRGIRYSLVLNEDIVEVESSAERTDFLPQILYINKKDRRYFLDFGHLQLAQRRTGGSWSFRRIVTEDREYMDQLEKNLILNPYFYYREGGYPFVQNSAD